MSNDAIKIDVKNSIVTRKHVTQCKPKDKPGSIVNVDCEWTFDFSNVTQDQLLELASRSVLISSRTTYKKLEMKDIEAGKVRTISVANFIKEGGRVRKDPVKKVKELTEKMSKEQLQELLEQLQSMEAEEE